MKIIVVGCGRMGAGLARALSLGGHEVSVVDHDPAAFSRLGPSFRGRTVRGSGIDRETLLAAGVERADGLAAVTARDEVNIVAGRAARQFFRVPRVAARLYDPLKAEIYSRLGLLTIAPVSWGIHRMADLLCRAPHAVTVSLGSGEVDIVEVELPRPLAGRTVLELTAPGELAVVAISRGGRTFLPTPGAVFHEGDVVHVAALGGPSGRLATLLGPS